jgi:hypothetical protein
MLRGWYTGYGMECVVILSAMEELDSYEGMQALLMGSTRVYQY